MGIEDKIGYKFRKKELLFQCLTHKSYGNEEKVPNNERLEFLGDSVLSIVVSKYLYKKLPNFQEGELSKIKNQLVSSKSLSDCVKKYRLEKFLKIGKGESKTKGRLKESNLSCLFEAIIGGIFLDSGIRNAEQFVLRTLLDIKLEEYQLEDYKSQLQVFIQKEIKEIPVYKVIKEEGPSHNKTFTVSVGTTKGLLAKGKGGSKKLAQNSAAEKALRKLL